jgi:hypothetical protein
LPNQPRLWILWVDRYQEGHARRPAAGAAADLL